MQHSMWGGLGARGMTESSVCQQQVCPKREPEARAVWWLIRNRKAVVLQLRPTLGREGDEKLAFLIPRLQRRERGNPGGHRGREWCRTGVEGECPEWASEANGRCLGTSASLLCRAGHQKVVLGTDRRALLLQGLALNLLWVWMNMPTLNTS